MILFLFIILNNFSNSLELYPIEFNKNITRGGSEEYIFVNDENKPVVYRVNLEMENENIAVTLHPRVFYLNPKERKNVKVFLKPIKELEKGEYPGYLNIETVPVDLSGKKHLKVNLKINIKAFI